jgi:molybdopterin-guanine dinucleotide biosynthesis protein B
MTVPVISVVGWHNAGKTTFVERLTAALKARGHRVATLKHAHGPFTMDREGTDTARYALAGSDLVGIVSESGAAMLRSGPLRPSLQALLAELPTDLDLAIIEGFKRSDMPKVEIRGGVESEALASPALCLAEISGLDAITESVEAVISTLLERGFLQPSTAFSRSES